MQKIVPQLWFDTQAREAIPFYVSAFPNSRVLSSNVLEGTPSGSVDVFSFVLGGLEMGAISAGPMFKINPSVSFMVNFDPSQDPQARERLDELWEKLFPGGKVLMPLQEYPFSKRYGWIEDRFGVSWQLILTRPEGEPRPFIIPSLMFTGDMTGRAGEAMDLYVSIFTNAKRGMSAPYPPGAAPEPAAKLMFAEFMLENQWFTAMDSGHMHAFGFNEALSFLVPCKDQAEIDYFWNAFTKDGGTEGQCGWLKDKFGFSWQIVPEGFGKMMSGDPQKVARVSKAFMAMKKMDVAKLEEAVRG